MLLYTVSGYESLESVWSTPEVAVKRRDELNGKSTCSDFKEYDTEIYVVDAPNGLKYRFDTVDNAHKLLTEGWLD